ncbi:PREDICTED: uncharacterized protein LOC108976540 [Bactrocera latifrons]|uniref:uncharacterized protein LOC108976540 n=1 Tax=Bactrocera latifrons TaxID=174628 RepID=UPI0008DD0D3E|nr:PREDICTED: uncharacterized protein LOC108976540 [Bactrocera latifrons]
MAQKTLKYVGVLTDNRLRYKAHIEKAYEKAARATAALARVMANIGGPSQNRRALLDKVSQSLMMYAAPIWGPALQQKTYAKKTKFAMRLSAVRVTCAFRTVSHEAVGSGHYATRGNGHGTQKNIDRSTRLGRRLTAEERKDEKEK